MRTIFGQSRSVAVIWLAVAMLAFVNWILNPDEAGRWLRAILILPGLGLGLTLWHLVTLQSLRRRGIDTESATRYFGSAIGLVFVPIGLMQILIHGLAIWLAIGDGRASPEFARRILGIASSLVFIVIGNGLPKILTPTSILPLGQAALVTLARRFIGTTLVVLGLVTALAFLAAPLVFATASLKWSAVFGFATILGAIVWMNVKAAKQEL